MATRKKTKKKATKVVKKKAVTRKKVAKKARRAIARAKPKARTKAPTKVKLKPRLAKPAAQAAAAIPANEERIGIVTHYFSHLSVAIIKLENSVLREGETVHIKGHTSDFRQPVGSMEIDHVHVSSARAGESFGLKVKEHAREHDVVYRVKGT
jgi:putative protease